AHSMIGGSSFYSPMHSVTVHFAHDGGVISFTLHDDVLSREA
ncbi:MAG: hypothetical protein QOF01_1720, partial [Thermomicrobiales bacterium]|nr:hypothetical protein [Thermomicrobiales bacterium]